MLKQNVLVPIPRIVSCRFHCVILVPLCTPTDRLKTAATCLRPCQPASMLRLRTFGARCCARAGLAMEEVGVQARSFAAEARPEESKGPRLYYGQ